MLSRKYKLKRDRDWKRIFKTGQSCYQDFIGIKYKKNDLNISRFGFIVGSRISKKAVARNRVKRQLEEIIRLHWDKIKTGFDVAVVIKPEIIAKKYQEIEIILINLLQKAKIYV